MLEPHFQIYPCFCRSHLEHVNIACQVVRFCLQKNPKERPNCASLLSKKFFKRDLQPDGIVKELLVHVPVVGEGEGGAERRDLGCAVIIGAASIVEQATRAVSFLKCWFVNYSTYYCVYPCRREETITVCGSAQPKYVLRWQSQAQELCQTYLFAVCLW